MNPHSDLSIQKPRPVSAVPSPESPSDRTEAEIRQFTASDGYRISYRHWPVSTGKPLGFVVALHGIQSHSQWYDYSCRTLQRAGYDVCFPDRRGSGLNEDARGDAPHVDRLVSDVVQFLGELRHRRDQQAPHAPVVLLGISWGGKLATVTAARSPELVDALALLSPGICARVRPGIIQKLMLNLAVNTGRGRQLTRIPLDNPALFSSDPQWHHFIEKDPLALRKVTTSFLKASCELDRLVQSAPERIRCPVMLMLAGKDQIIDNDATRRFFDRFHFAERELKEYAEAAHTLEFEPCREQVANDLLHWMQSLRSQD